MALTHKAAESDDELTWLLAQRVALDDGSTAPVIVKQDLKYHCNACSVFISSLVNLKEHMNGKNHARSMAKNVHPASKFQNVPVEERKMPILGGVELAPGEPIPPGFEDEVKRVPEILETLNSMVSPLLGLEFLAEVVGPSKETEARYLCMLCDKKGTRSTVMQHLVCFNHRIRYLNHFFPRTYNAFQAIPKIAKYRRGTGEILSKVAREIEKKFGRLEPAVYDEKDFDEKKANLFQSMFEGPHALETPECKFETLVNLDEIHKIASKTTDQLKIDEETQEAKRLSATPKTAFKYGLTRRDEVFKKKSPPPKEPAPRPEKRAADTWSVTSLSSLSSSSRSPSPTRARPLSRSPKRRRFYDRNSRSRSPKMWSRSYRHSRSKSPSPVRTYRRRSPYRRRVDRKSPPRYSRRNSPPARSTGFRPTISSFKIKTTPTLSQKDLDEEHARKLKIRQFEDYSKTVKEEMSQKLKLFEKTPEKHPLYSEEWKKFWNKRYKELIADGKDASKHDFKPEWIKYWTEKIKDLHEEEMAKRLNAFRADLGLPVAKDDDSDDDVVILPQPRQVEAEPEPEPEPDPEESNSLIHVLRLLAALENQLGSFQSRVNAMFTKALSLEKVEKRSADALLDTPDILVLLEGVKEKLKGQLFTGVIDRHLIKGTKKAIQGLAGVLSNHEQKKQEKLKPPEPLIVPGVGFIDKVAIAQQIAATLVEQGRTDLSDDDLEQLIMTVVGLTQVNTAPAAAAAPPETVKKESNLQSLLSSVVATQNANDSLQRLQNYDEDESKKNFNDFESEESSKKFVRNMDERSGRSKSRQTEDDDFKSKPSGKLSPFSLREGGANPINEEDDDDDYSYEDIFKAAKKNVKKEQAKKRHDKEVALQMIDDQKKSFAESAPKPAVLIDPDDLLNGMKSSMAQNTQEIVTPEIVPANQPVWDGYQYTNQPQQNYDFTADPTYSYNNNQNFPAQNEYQQQQQQWVDPNSYQAQGYNPNNGYDYSQQMYNVPPPDQYHNPPPNSFSSGMNNPHAQYQGYY